MHRHSFGSPERQNGGIKRQNESPTKTKIKIPKTQHQAEEPRFTFDEVQEMIERLLAKQGKPANLVTAASRKINYEDIAVGDHSPENCKDLIEKLIHNTRRVRTLEEVLLDIKENLKKRSYTEIIHRASLKGQLPKRPPSAYLLYHQDRYAELKPENHLAVEVSKIVANEWKNLSSKRRREYARKHDEMMKAYEDQMTKLGLIDKEAPKRPKSAKSMFIEENLNSLMEDDWDKETIAQKKEELGEMFEKLAPEDKQQWVLFQKENLDRYLEEKEKYIAAHPHLNHSIPERKSRTSERVKPPEPPATAFKFYLQKKMPTGLENSLADYEKKRLKEKFNKLSEKKVLKYIKKAIQDRERYEREVEEFKAKYPNKEIPKQKSNVSKEHMKLWAKVIENRPNLPAPTAYLHYCGRLLVDMDKNDDTRAPTKRMQTASNSWKTCSEEVKKAAEKEHLEEVQRYITGMERWMANQTEERRIQVLTEEPKANPEYWRKKLNRMIKQEKKRASETINL